jgi:hypothetical protein
MGQRKPRLPRKVTPDEIFETYGVEALALARTHKGPGRVGVEGTLDHGYLQMKLVPEASLLSVKGIRARIPVIDEGGVIFAIRAGLRATCVLLRDPRRVDLDDLADQYEEEARLVLARYKERTAVCIYIRENGIIEVRAMPEKDSLWFFHKESPHPALALMIFVLPDWAVAYTFRISAEVTEEAPPLTPAEVIAHKSWGGVRRDQVKELSIFPLSRKSSSSPGTR